MRNWSVLRRKLIKIGNFCLDTSSNITITMFSFLTLAIEGICGGVAVGDRQDPLGYSWLIHLKTADRNETLSILVLNNLHLSLKNVPLTPIAFDLWPFSQDHSRPDWRFSDSFVSAQLLQFRHYHPKTSWRSYLMPIAVIQVPPASATFAQGHFGSYKVTCVFFLLINSNKNKLEWCGLSHGVPLAKTHRLICILNFFVNIKVTWSEVKIWPWPFWINKCMLLCVSRRELR